MSKRDNREAAEEYLALQDGVPVWLKQSLWEWAVRRMTSQPGRSASWNEHQLGQVERRLRIQLDWSSGTFSAGPRLESLAKTNDEVFLNLIDLLLNGLTDTDTNLGQYAIPLDMALIEGSSAFRVAIADGRLKLERRVNDTVTTEAKATMTAAGVAGEHLAQAWAEAYGLHPNQSKAYIEAVKAVEAAAQPIVTPRDSKATLGKIISALRDAPDKWEVVLSAPPKLDRVEVVRLMADLLWQGQTDRHGTPNPVPVTQGQAEAAVHLAVLLVQWFNAGSIRRRPT